MWVRVDTLCRFTVLNEGCAATPIRRSSRVVELEWVVLWGLDAVAKSPPDWPAETARRLWQEGQGRKGRYADIVPIGRKTSRE